jgi:hypothetical protein
MKLATIARYASGKAPFLGVPVFDLAEGRTVTVVLKRDHLRVAVEAATIHGATVTYDCEAHTLNFNSVKGCCYTLRDLRQQVFPWREQLLSWAEGRRKTAISRALPENEKRIAKLRLEIGKLERRRDKIRSNRPQSPLLLTEWQREPESDSARKQELNWREEKPIRRALGRLVRQERKTWAQFYRDVEQITGRRVDSSRRHDRVCNRRGGPARTDYLTYLYKHIWMAAKPYRAPWEPLKKTDRTGDGGETVFEQHRRWQIEYLMALDERAGIQTEIDGHLQTIAELGGAR